MLSIGSLMSHENVFFEWLSDNNKHGYVTSVYGSIPCKFQSGRCVNHLKEFNIDNFISVIKKYNSFGIKVYLTFSRYNLSEEDLKDEKSNMILSELNNISSVIKNGVIISNDSLLKLIKNSYSNLICISSILKPTYESTFWKNDDPDYYNSLCNIYDYVVVNPAKIIDSEFRAQLNQKEKIIILKNSRCQKNCPLAVQHYESQNLFDDAVISGETGEAEKNAMSLITRKCSELHDPLNTQFISNSKMMELYNEGFKNWKLDGREYSDELFILELNDFIECIKQIE